MWLEDCSIAGSHIYLESTNQGLGCCWAKVRGGKTEEGEDRETLSKLGDCGKWQAFVRDCNVAIVILGKESLTDMWLEDCSIAGAHIYLEATNQGLGCCWAKVRGGKTEEGEEREEYVRNILDIPSEYRVVSIMAIGYPAIEPPPHSEEEYDKNRVHEDLF
jgi:nitroreductase